jgi:hypothetical protein
VVAQGRQVRPARDQHDLVPGEGQAPADRAADRARADDDVSHAEDFRTRPRRGPAQAPPRQATCWSGLTVRGGGVLGEGEPGVPATVTAAEFYRTKL